MSSKHPATLKAERAYRELCALRAKGGAVEEQVLVLQRYFAKPGERECSPEQAEQRANAAWGTPA